jgi:hypothetical protein
VGPWEHHPDLGRRVHAEAIELQQRVAQVPLPPEPDKGHPVLRGVAAVVGVLLVVAVSWLLIHTAAA